MPKRSYYIANKHRHADGNESDDPPYVSRKNTNSVSSLNRSLCSRTVGEYNEINHPNFPAFNATDVPLNGLDELQSYPSVNLRTPHVIFVAEGHSPCPDICYNRTRVRATYRKLLKTARTKFNTVSQAQRNVRKKAKEHLYPRAIFDFAERMESNPDPYFYGSYDYYYTGGNLCTIPYEDNSYNPVVHVNESNLTRLNLSMINSDDEAITLKPISSLSSIDKRTEVFELCTLRSSSERDSHLFATRQQHSVTLYALRDECQRIAPLTQLRATGTPFISLAQSAGDNKMLLVSSMTQHLRLYDLVTNKPQSFKLDDIVEPLISWNIVRPWEDHVFLYANEKKLCFADMRIEANKWSWFSYKKDLICELISSIATSNYKKLFYVASNHNLYCMDTRFTKKRSILRWTHQMNYPPAFIDTLHRQNTEIVALSSALPVDLRICELKQNSTTANEVQYKSYSLPYQPPTLQEAYDHARLAGKCLQPETDLARRLRRCTTGLKFVAGNDGKSDTLLLTANSIGDVFASIVSEQTDKEYQRANAFTDTQISRYAERVCANVQHKLKYTEIVDLSAMRRIFLCKNLSNKKEDDHTEDTPDEARLRHRSLGRWQKSLATLHSFKDALVPNLLDIWDIDFEPERGIHLKHLNKDLLEKPDSKTIVSKWLQQDEPMVVIPFTSLNNTIDELGQESQIDVTLQQSEEFLELNGALAHSTQIVEEQQISLIANSTLTENLQKSRKVKKKAKYVKGF